MRCLLEHENKDYRQDAKTAKKIIFLLLRYKNLLGGLGVLAVVFAD